MSSNKPVVISRPNLSHAWGETLLYIKDHAGKEIAPLVINITDLKDGIPQEELAIREALDKCLADHGKQSIEDVANTIFPSSYWEQSNHNRHEFFQSYLNDIPKMKEDAKTNRPCLYFERLIAFDDSCPNGNQLDFIISNYNSLKEKDEGVRRSMLQATLFDPKTDHIPNPYLSFPCLQHISFVYKKDGTMTLNAFYTIQYIFQKAYGNYLGLCRLGNFMAHEMNLKFDSLNCFVGIESLEVPKEHLDPVIQVVRDILEPISDE